MNINEKTKDRDISLPEHRTMSRFEKVEFLRETTTVDTYTKNMLEEMIMFMSEEYFSEFYDHFCSCYDICRSYEELNERYGDE